MKYYIRTTHNFNNETREWEYRNLPEWENIRIAIVHAIDRDIWEPEFMILNADKEWTEQDLGINLPLDFEKNQLKDLELAVRLDMVREKNL